MLQRFKNAESIFLKQYYIRVVGDRVNTELIRFEVFLCVDFGKNEMAGFERFVERRHTLCNIKLYLLDQYL